MNPNTKKTKPSKFSLDIKNESLKALGETKFDQHGLRLIENLEPEEYCFTSVPEDVVPSFLAYELLRESLSVHQRIRQLRGIEDRHTSGDIPQTVIDQRFFTALPVLLECVENFPLPLLSIQQGDDRPLLSEQNSFKMGFPIFKKPTPIQEVPLEPTTALSLLERAPDLENIHAFHLNFEFHTNGALVKAFKNWVDTRRKQGGIRPSYSDHLNQLAAWRAHRAGLTHSDFLHLNPRPKLGYADASAFRKACEIAESEILRAPPF